MRNLRGPGPVHVWARSRGCQGSLFRSATIGPHAGFPGKSSTGMWKRNGVSRLMAGTFTDLGPDSENLNGGQATLGAAASRTFSEMCC